MTNNSDRWLKLERPLMIAALVILLIAGNSYLLWRTLKSGTAAAILGIEEVQPHTMRVGDPIPGTAAGAYYGGWYHEQNTLNVLITDVPHQNHEAALMAHLQQYPTQVDTPEPDEEVFAHNTSLHARAAHDTPNHTGWDHCTIWPVNPSLSACNKRKGLGEMYQNAGADHTRALMLYLINFCFDPVPEQIPDWPVEYASGCLLYRRARICLGWPWDQAPDRNGRPFVPVIKRQILDYSMTCAQEGKSVQHLIAGKSQFRTICFSSKKADCAMETMGCHAREHQIRVAECEKQVGFLPKSLRPDTPGFRYWGQNNLGKDTEVLVDYEDPNHADE